MELDHEKYLRVDQQISHPHPREIQRKYISHQSEQTHAIPEESAIVYIPDVVDSNLLAIRYFCASDIEGNIEFKDYLSDVDKEDQSFDKLIHPEFTKDDNFEENLNRIEIEHKICHKEYEDFESLVSLAPVAYDFEPLALRFYRKQTIFQ